MIGESGFENITWFMGLVEDNNDPVKAGRVKVRCFGFHPPYSEGTVDTADLPWAHVIRNGTFASVPDNGELVIGFFIDGRDAQHPMVMGVVNSAKFSAPTSHMPGLSNVGQQQTSKTIPPGATISYQDAYNLALDAGFTPTEAQTMAAIAVAESGLNSSAYNGTPPDDSYGLWQINMIGALGPERRSSFGIGSNDALFDPQTNARAAYQVYKSQGFRAWSTYTNGAYLSYIDTPLQVGVSTTPELENPYLAPSADAANNFGNNAMPPQMTGEGLQDTPALVQATARRTVQFSSASGGYTADEPGVPVSASTKTSVWSMRHGGSYIELAGKEADKEFINITHVSGSRVTLDANGNVSIKAFGKLHLSSEGVIEEISSSTKAAIHSGGYILDISGGNADITVDGNLNFSATGDINFGAGRKITMSSGDTIDVMGSKIAITAKTDAIDIMAAQKLALSSHGTGLSIASVDGLYLQSTGGDISVKSNGALGLAAGTVGIQASGAMKVKGAPININTAGEEPPDVPDSLGAVGAFVPNPPKLGIATPTKPIPTPTGISPAMVDESTGPR